MEPDIRQSTLRAVTVCARSGPANMLCREGFCRLRMAGSNRCGRIFCRLSAVSPSHASLDGIQRETLYSHVLWACAMTKLFPLLQWEIRQSLRIWIASEDARWRSTEPDVGYRRVSRGWRARGFCESNWRCFLDGRGADRRRLFKTRSTLHYWGPAAWRPRKVVHLEPPVRRQQRGHATFGTCDCDNPLLIPGTAAPGHIRPRRYLSSLSGSRGPSGDW